MCSHRIMRAFYRPYRRPRKLAKYKHAVKCVDVGNNQIMLTTSYIDIQNTVPSVRQSKHPLHMPANRVVHLTSVHSRYDTRIFLKECRSLGKVGYRVALIVADGKGDEIKEGIDILDVGKPRSRFSRM